MKKVLKQIGRIIALATAFVLMLVFTVGATYPSVPGGGTQPNYPIGRETLPAVPSDATLNSVYTAGYSMRYVYDQVFANGCYIGSNWGNASSWYTKARNSGYTVNTTPAAGAVMVLSESGTGQVGYVEEVLGNDVIVATMDVWNVVTRKIYTWNQARGYYFIQPKTVYRELERSGAARTTPITRGELMDMLYQKWNGSSSNVNRARDWAWANGIVTGYGGDTTQPGWEKSLSYADFYAAVDNFVRYAASGRPTNNPTKPAFTLPTNLAWASDAISRNTQRGLVFRELVVYGYWNDAVSYGDAWQLINAVVSYANGL
jgi:hypothetical protein